MFIILRTVVCEDSGAIVAESSTKFVPEEKVTAPAPSAAADNALFSDLIVLAFRKHDRLTLNEVRRSAHPERRGGLAAFRAAWSRLIVSGVIRKVARTQR